MKSNQLDLDSSNVANIIGLVPEEYRKEKHLFSIQAEQNENGKYLFVIRGTREKDNFKFIVTQFKRGHICSVDKIAHTPDPDIIACASNAPEPPIFLYSLREQKLLSYTRNLGGRHVFTHNCSTHDWLLSTRKDGNITVEKTPDYKVISKVETGPYTSEVKIRLFSPMKKVYINCNQQRLLPLTNDGVVDDQLVRSSLPKTWKCVMKMQMD